MYTRPDKPDYIDAKGIQLVRRDNAPFVKDISKTVLHKIMYDRDILGSMDLVQDRARDLLEGRIPVDQLERPEVEHQLELVHNTRRL
eukprot:5153597-Pyramimonas_sp.AAC.1